MLLRKYVVSQDPKSKLWYCHQKGFSNVPCGDSFCEKKSEARENMLQVFVVAFMLK